MPDNVLQVWPQIFSVVAGAIVLFGGALALAVRHRARLAPGSSGHRDSAEEGESEIIAPDGYIDAFANFAEEAGGSVPVMLWVTIVVTLAAYVGYMVLFWQPR
jgi:hypothetical protein